MIDLVFILFSFSFIFILFILFLVFISILFILELSKEVWCDIIYNDHICHSHILQRRS